MTGTDLCVNKSQFVPVIFEPPCTCETVGDVQEDLQAIGIERWRGKAQDRDLWSE
jgi:hypothetical protein